MRGFGLSRRLGRRRIGAAPPAVRTFYVDNVAGLDTNNGLTPATAWATVAKVNAGPAGGYLPGDSILFQGGQTFAGTRLDIFLSAYPALAGVTIGSFGAGRATIKGSGAAGVARIIDVGGIAFQNLILDGNATPTAALYAENQSTTARLGPLSFTNIDVINANSGFDIENWNEAGGSAAPYGWNTITFDGCKITGSATATGIGIYITARMNVGDPYAYSNVTIRNSEVTGMGSSGIEVYSIDGYTLANNYIHNNGGRNQFGTGAELEYCNNFLVEHNEVSFQALNTGATDSQGIDVDMRNTNGVVRHNYLHDNAGGGIACQQTTVGVWDNVSIYGNVLWNNCTASSNLNGELILGVAGQNGMTNLRVFNNTIYNNRGASNINALILLRSATSPTGYVANNLLYSGTNPRLIDAASTTPNGLLFRGNSYFSGAGQSNKVRWANVATTNIATWRTNQPTQETVAGADTSIITDPKLTTPAAAAPVMGLANVTPAWVPGTVTPPRLQAGSPCIGSGLDLTTFGITPPTKTFWNDNYPAPGGRSRGADAL